jgi:hypothetical protein
MREWIFWDWAGYTVLWIAIVLSAIDQAFKVMPVLSAHLEPAGARAKMYLRAGLAFSPLVFLIIATVILLARAGGLIDGPTEQRTATTLTWDQGLYEGRPLAIAWASARLAEYSPNTISAFIVDAHNPGPNEVTVHDAYILSLIDSTRIPMHIVNPSSDPPSERTPISVAMPVPRNAYLSFEASFDAGISETEFSTRWHDFSVVLEFDHTEISRDFNRLWVVDHINQNHPESQPHISRRQQ